MSCVEAPHSLAIADSDLDVVACNASLNVWQLGTRMMERVASALTSWIASSHRMMYGCWI